MHRERGAGSGKIPEGKGGVKNGVSEEEGIKSGKKAFFYWEGGGISDKL